MRLGAGFAAIVDADHEIDWLTIGEFWNNQPAEPDTFRVTLNLVNRSGQYSSSPGSHDVAIVPEIDDVFLAIAAREITGHVVWDAITPTISADETASITFVPDEPGTYHYLCTVPGHAQHGMIGTLVVEE